MVRTGCQLQFRDLSRIVAGDNDALGNDGRDNSTGAQIHKTASSCRRVGQRICERLQVNRTNAQMSFLASNSFNHFIDYRWLKPAIPTRLLQSLRFVPWIFVSTGRSGHVQRCHCCVREGLLLARGLATAGSEKKLCRPHFESRTVFSMPPNFFFVLVLHQRLWQFV